MYRFQVGMYRSMIFLAEFGVWARSRLQIMDWPSQHCNATLLKKRVVIICLLRHPSFSMNQPCTHTSNNKRQLGWGGRKSRNGSPHIFIVPKPASSQQQQHRHKDKDQHSHRKIVNISVVIPCGMCFFCPTAIAGQSSVGKICLWGGWKKNVSHPSLLWKWTKWVMLWCSDTTTSNTIMLHHLSCVLLPVCVLC